MSSQPTDKENAPPKSTSAHRLRHLRSRRNPGYERPSLRTFIDKIEEFDLALDPEDVGETEGWFIPGHKQFTQTAVIGPIELLPNFVPGVNGKTVVWYHKIIHLPQPLPPAKHYKINFARAFYRTKVWANGQLLADVDGKTEHISGFSAFSYDLTGSVSEAGQVEITIRVENNDDPAICRAKQWSRQYPRQGIWYNQASGLWGQVTLEEVSANRLRSDITGYADAKTGLVKLEVITAIANPGSYVLEAAVTSPENETNFVQYRRTVYLAPGQASHELSFVVPQPQEWSPDNPILYKVTVTLRQNGDSLDQIFFNIGFRSIEARGNQLFLNNRSLYVSGVLYQPYHGDSYTLSYEELKADLDYIRKVVGANLVRIHIAGADPLPLYIADLLGLLVWVEVPSPHVSNEVSRANHWRELESLLRQIDTHPCVAFVSIYNESWGCQDIAEQSAAGAATRAYIKRAYTYIKQTRPDLLVVDNDGWEHIAEAGKLVATDFASLHLYDNNLTSWEQDLKDIEQFFEADNKRYSALTGHQLVVTDSQEPDIGSYYYQKEKPLIISEWGGFGALYGGPAAQLEKFELVRRYKAALHSQQQQIAGDCYTQLVDVEQETNGLLDKERQRLIDTSFLEMSKGLLE